MNYPYSVGQRFLWVLVTCCIVITYNGCAGDAFKSIDVADSSSDNTGQNNSPSNLDSEGPIAAQPSDQQIVEPQGKGAALLVTGHMKASMYSCDGGLTWEGYRSFDNEKRCWQKQADNFDCDHDFTSNKGLTYGPKGFMATFGWGKIQGGADYTEDGNIWTRVADGNFAGLAASSEVYVLHSREPRIVDSQLAVSIGNRISYSVNNARTMQFLDIGSGLFMGAANTNGISDFMVSRDGGRTFNRPLELPEVCGNGRIAHNGSRILLHMRDDTLCYSDDLGETWQVAQDSPPQTSGLLFAEGFFKLYAEWRVYLSKDGMNWQEEVLTVNGQPHRRPVPGLVSYDPVHKRYAWIGQSWQTWYEKTQYYFSDDGIQWTSVNKLAGEAPLAPHPMKAIAFGFLSSCSP